MSDNYVLYLQGDNLFVSSYYDYRVKEDHGLDVEYIKSSHDKIYLQHLANTLVVMDFNEYELNALEVTLGQAE